MSNAKLLMINDLTQRRKDAEVQSFLYFIDKTTKNPNFYI